MDNRSGPSDSSNAPTSSANSMPNILFREIHKNAFLKRHSSDRRAGFPKKSERVWVVFCVHDDVEPFLEIYPDQKVALTHKPEWFASLSNVLHVSPTICGHEDEFEFAVTLSFQVVRLAAPTWESMMEWVETIRNKLRELKVLCPKENVYSKMPEPKQQLLPTRDPNSPLPLPPEGPSTLLPGVELVHLQSRNSSSSSDNGDSGRRDVALGRNNIILEKPGNRKHKDKRPVVPETMQPPSASSSSSVLPLASSSSSSFTPNENLQEPNENDKQLNTNTFILKPKDQKIATVLQPASQISLESNVTVIQVPMSSYPQQQADASLVPQNSVIENDDLDDVFQVPSASHKTEIKTSGPSPEEAHYEHVFLLNIPCKKSQPSSSSGKNLNSKSSNLVTDMTKPHSTSVLIGSTHLTQVSSSPIEGIPGTSGLSPVLEAAVTDVQVGGTMCVKVPDKRDSVTQIQIQKKLEKVNISSSPIAAKVPYKSVTKPAQFKLPFPSTENELNEPKSPLIANSGQTSHHRAVIVKEEDDAGKTENDVALYSQVKKIPKAKAKSDETRNQVINGSPVFSRKKVNDIFASGSVSNNSLDVAEKVQKNGKSPGVRAPENRSPVPKTRVNIIKDSARNVAGCSSSSSSGTEFVPSTPSTGGSQLDNSKSAPQNSIHNNGNNSHVEVEPIAATIPPAVGVISVEDIPLIGGHQRRRKRSSSSDPVPPPSATSSRAIGGADRIRINVPQTGNPLGREELRGEPESGNNSRSPVTDQIVQINVTPQSSRLTLREQQVLQLRKEMLHPGGVRLQLRRKDCIGSIALVDALNGVWVAGWKQKERPLLYNALHIGDQLISVSDIMVRTAADAQKLIKTAASFHIEFIIRRVPFGNVFALQRTSEGQPLGIVQEGNTAEIKEILANSLAARQGLTSKTPSSDGLSLTTWFITEINGRPLNLFFKDTEVKDRLNAVGKEISILVQPHDFIKQIKKQLKNLRGYKDYIVQ